MQAIITVGLGFGDEGKGSVVDYFTRTYRADLVVRYCGGHQAAHNVVLPDGTHHTFAQFGSGTLSGVKTYLAPQMIVEPLALLNEAVALQKLGLDPDPRNIIRSMIMMDMGCLITTPWHKLLNQMKEVYRLRDRHGSCGVGIGETRKYWLDYGSDAIVAGDFMPTDSTKLRDLVDKAELCRQRILIEAQAYVNNRTENLLRQMYKISPMKWVSKAHDVLRFPAYTNTLPGFNTAIFEGAQGLLLDEYIGFHPHTTWSTLTSSVALDMLSPAVDTQVVGIIRGYHTRHGAGPFPTESIHRTEHNMPKSEHNALGDWQGTFRLGIFDLPLFKYAIKADGNIDKIFMTCLDHCDTTAPETKLDVSVKYDWNPYDYARTNPRKPTPDEDFLTKEPVPDLDTQEAIGKELDKVLPPKETIGVYDLFKEHLNDGPPLAWTSYGPTFADKQLA